MVNKLLAVVLFALAVSQWHVATNINLLFLASCLLMAFVNRFYINITSLITIIAVAKLGEIVVLSQFLQGKSNYIILSFYILLDISVSLMIAFRAALMRKAEVYFKGNVERDKYLITNADLFLGLMYIFYCVLNLITLFEHGLRHLDDFGFEKNIWLFENARFFWANYGNIKIPLNILEFGIILLTIKNFMRSERMVRT